MAKTAKVHPVKVTIKEMSGGECSVGHKLGDSWSVDPRTTPNGMCTGAFMAMISSLRGMAFGADYPWAEKSGNDDIYNIVCPDPKTRVVFEIRRIRE